MSGTEQPLLVASSVLKNSMMAVLLLPLLMTACAFLGVGLWVICSHFLTADIPAAIGHPVKLRVLDCLFLLLLRWVSSVFDFSSPPEGSRRRLGKHMRRF